MESVRNILAQHPFFAGISVHNRQILELLATAQRFESHQTLFECGTTADKFYLIHSGSVALQTQFIAGRGVITIETLGAGEALGWSWLFPPYEWHFGAMALETTETIFFDASDLREHAQENCEFGYDLALRVGGVLLHRLQAARRQLIESQEHL